ncbi:MAG: M16 family metallopeptidase [Pyrinomonadaceae bacterium]
MKRFSALLLAGLLLMSAAPVPASAQGQLKLPSYKKVKLKNGMTLLLMEQHEVPLISFSLILEAGSVSDPAGKEGLASLTAALLRKGTKTRTADQISAELDFIGGTMGVGAVADYTSGSAEFVNKDVAKALDLIADVLLNAQFPQEELTKLVKQRVDGIKSAKDQAQGVIGSYFNAYLYGSHPYGRPTGGDEQSLAAITRDDVLKFYQDYYFPANTILAVVGDFTAPDMERMLSDKFGVWPAKHAALTKVPEPTPVAGKRLLLVDKPDSTQTFYRVGNVGISRTNRDRIYVDVVNKLFGGRFTSMLNSELRIKTGLTYGAGSFFDERKASGPFVISTYTKNETTERAIDLTLEILKRLHEKGISEEELKSAKTYIKGQYPPEIETTDQLASLIAQLEFFGLDEREVNDLYAKIDAMTLTDARRIIDQYYPQDNLVFVLIGKANEIQAIARKYAPRMDTKSISEVGFQVKSN